MAKIKTVESVLFDSRHQYSSFIELEITKFQEVNNGINIEVSDFIYKNIEIINEFGEQETIEQKSLYYSRPIFISTQEMDAIASAVESQLPTDVTESQRREAIKKSALLYYVQNDRLKGDASKCIYNTDPVDWEIVIE